MKPLAKWSMALIPMTATIALAGCGGGGSDSNTATTTTTSSSSSTSSSTSSSPASSSSSSSSSVATGTGTAAVLTAANAFLATLSTTQKTVATSSSYTSTVLFDFTKANAIVWTNLPGGRHGLRLNTSTLTTDQLAAAETLITTALSTAGKTEQDEIRKADDVIAAVNANGGWGSGLYSIAIFGTPSTTAPWMLQITGHHLAYNITYNSTYVSGTPTFVGVEPPNWVVTSSGTIVVNGTASTAGTQHAPIETQRAALYTLATAIQANATYATAAKLTGTYTDVILGANGNSDSNFGALAYPTTGRGVLFSTLDSAAQADVRAAIEAYVNLMPSDIATTLLAQYESDTALASTYVAYSPGTGGTADFSAYPNSASNPLASQHSYIRIDGPRIWIEFVVQQGVAYTSYVHYHSLWRDKIADYGGQFGTGSGS